MQSDIDLGRESALRQLNDLEKSLVTAVRRVVDALKDDGRIDVGEGIGIGSTGLTMGMQVAGLLRGLNADSAENLLYVLENSERVFITDG